MNAIAFGNLSPLSDALNFAIAYDSKPEFANKPRDGKRWCFIGYKKTTKNPNPPQNFAIPLDIFTVADVQKILKGTQFIHELLCEHQDKIAHATVDGWSKVQPDNWEAIVADWFDTTRARNAITKAQVEEWIDESFLPAFMKRQLELGTADEKIAMLAKAYEGYCKAISGRVCDLSKPIINSMRQTIEKLRELGMLEDSDETKHMHAQCVKFLSETQGIIADSV